MDKCQRCGNVGEDRRTLRMACFYEMDELKVPFDSDIVLHGDEHTDYQIVKEPDSIQLKDGTSICIGSGQVTTESPLTPMKLYTLRVCKRCRGEWMAAIKQWFNSPPKGEDHDSWGPDPHANCQVNSEVFIREHDAIKEMTREEFNLRKEFQQREEENQRGRR